MRTTPVRIATITFCLFAAACSSNDNSAYSKGGNDNRGADGVALGSYWVDDSGARHWNDDGREPAKETVHIGLYSLSEAESCQEIVSQWQQGAMVEMKERLADARHRILNPDYCYYEEWGVMDCLAAADIPMSPPDDDNEEASEYSTTNTQEVGVDEADFLKNDGSTIYLVANGEFRIIDVWPPEEAHVLSVTQMPATPRRLYIHKDRAIIFSSPPAYGGAQADCTYGYDCEFTGEATALTVTVYDISDKTHPLRLRTITYSGGYLNSRRIEDVIHTVVHFDEPKFTDSLPVLPDKYQAYGHGCIWEDDELPEVDLDELDAAFAQLEAANSSKIMATTLTDWLPAMTDTWHFPDKNVQFATPLQSCDDYFVAQTGDGASLMSVVSFDLTKQEPLNATTIVAKPGAVYASKQALYVATRHTRGWSPSGNADTTWFAELPDAVSEATTVHKFILSAETPTTSYSGSGLIKGHVLNQFAMSDYQGKLRIATTHGHVPQPDVHSTISVLEPGNGQLNLIGQLDNLAPTEDIRSVRFGTELGFIVTFKKTDPLFVIDLSNPTAPTVKGELKIPGFSTYMQFMDKNHLLTIGYDADDQGSFAWFTGIQLQILDVTDITNPKLKHKEVIGTRGSTSDATTNHFAFNYFKPKDLLAIPMVVCEEAAGGGSYATDMTFNGLMVYDVTIETGFSYHGGIPHAQMQDDPYYGGQCHNWWTESNSTVKRSIIMDDYVLSIALDAIKISLLDDLEHPIKELPLL